MVRSGWAWVYFKESRSNRISLEAVGMEFVGDDSDTPITCLTPGLMEKTKKNRLVVGDRMQIEGSVRHETLNFQVEVLSRSLDMQIWNLVIWLRFGTQRQIEDIFCPWD